MIYRRDPALEFLLLHYAPPKNYWQSLTGNVEEGEEETSALKREIHEETGLPTGEIMEVRKMGRFEFSVRGRAFSETVYAVRVRGKSGIDLSINPDHEHNAYGWFRPETASRLVRWDQARSAIGEIASAGH